MKYLDLDGLQHLWEQLKALFNNKVDKISGKGLSANDYTDAEKSKLAGIAAKAEVNQNAFSNVKVGTSTVAADSKTDTLEIAAGSNITLSADTTNDKVTISAKDTTYSAATTSTAGLMSAADKTKLNGIAEGANKYTHPSTHPASMITQDSTHRFVSDAEKQTWADKYTKNEVDNKLSALETKIDWKEAVDTFDDIESTYPDAEEGWTVSVNDTDTVYRFNGTSWIGISANTIPLATSSVDGKMSKADKAKLDGIASGANKYVLPTASSSTLGGVKTTSNVTSTSGLTACPIISGVPYYKDTNTTYNLSSFGITADASEINKLDGLATTKTELGYLDGVTSNVQTQLNGKLSTSGTAAKATADASGQNIANTYIKGLSVNGKVITYTKGDGSTGSITTQDTNTTYSDMKGATSSANGVHGLVPQPDKGEQGKFLRGDGTWQTPTNTTYSTMTGATSEAAGKSGLVPAPAAGAQAKFLRGDGTWQTPANTTYGAAGTSLGLVKSGGDVTISNGTITVNDDSHNHTIANIDNLQTTLNGKANTSHTHNYAGSSSAGGAATSASKLNAINLTNQNLNDYRSGVNFYYAGGGNTCTNKPSGVDNFGMFVFQSASGWWTQMLYGSTGIIYTRRYSIDTWTAWVEMYSSANKPTPSEIGAAASSHSHNYAGSSSAGGVANSAAKLSTARSITLGGDVSGSASFDGSANVTITATVKDDSHAHTIANVDGLQTALDGKLATTGTAAKATADATGQNIADTYIKGLSVNGRTITYTKGDGGTGTITTQDTNTTYSNMKGATSSAAGSSGLVPAPSAGASNRYLRSDGTWVVPPDTNTTYSDMKGATSSANGTHGLVPQPDAGEQTKFLRGDGTWQTPANTTYGAAGTSLGLVKSGGDVTISNGTITVNDDSHNHTIANIDNLQTTLDGKSNTNHTHNYAGSSSAGGAATSANKVANALTIQFNGSTKSTFNGSAASTVNITPSGIGAAASSHGTHVPSTCKSITDWNSATTTGWYMGSGASNAPTSGESTWYFGYVIAHNTNYVYQEVYQFTASTDAKSIPKYIRAKMNGTWGSWTNVTVAKAVPSDAVFTDTKYSLATFGITATAAELNKLDGVTATATELNYVDGVTSNIQTQLNGKLSTSGTAAKATADDKGQNIADTYIKGLSVNGRTITYTKGDGGTGTITTQDTNTTYSNMTGASSSAAGKSGLVPAPSAGAQSKFLRGDGTWQTPTNTTYSNMTGATSSAAGKAGLVPAPAAGKQTSFLRGDGTWVVPTNTDTKATQTNTTTNADYRVVLSTNANDTTETNTLRKSVNFQANPSTGAFYAKGYERIDISNLTVDIDDYTLSSGSPHIMRYIEKTSGGASKITNIPVTGQPFILDVELIRWASTTDYITVQTFRSTSARTTIYYRTCNSGTWTAWTTSPLTYSLSSFGITATAAELNKLDGVTATATELNYVDGVTSNIQTQLNGKASTSHTHNYAGSSSAGGAANSAAKLSTARTIRTNLGSTSTASFDGSANITPGVTGTLAVGNGGTGATTAAAARTKLGFSGIVVSSTEPTTQNTNEFWLRSY